jgi:DNA-binding NarL/FixJ family response regulator
MAGANGFISKGARLTEIEEALGRVAQGHEHASAELKERVSASRSPFGKRGGFAALSEAERSVLRELGRGKTVKDIARITGVSSSTVGTYRGRILSKLELRTTAELVRYVVQHRLWES